HVLAALVHALNAGGEGLVGRERENVQPGRALPARAEQLEEIRRVEIIARAAEAQALKPARRNIAGERRAQILLDRVRGALVEFVHRIAVERIGRQRLRAEFQITGCREIAIAQAVVIRIETETLRILGRESAHMPDAGLHAEIAALTLLADAGAGRSIVIATVTHRRVRTAQLARENL